VVLYEHKFIDSTGTLQYYYSFIMDMTEHKRLENALRTSEAKYRELVENANSIILKLDTCGNITFFNEFAQLYFGYQPGEILGKNVIGTIVPITESSGRDLSKLIKDICCHPERYINNENENMRSNGERVWVSWTNKAITDDHGNLIGILCVGNDITALKNAEIELKRARDELELRVRERTAELEKVNKFLLNEIEARKQAEKGVKESEEKFRILIGREITIRLESPEGCFVCVDRLLYDVFSNIVDNSIRYSSGPVDINISLSIVEMDDKKFSRVSIEDNGPGIKPDLKKRIFNRMHYEGGIMRGKGLGLYLVKTLVEYFHGNISVEDRIPGDHTKGARFVVTLPAM